MHRWTTPLIQVRAGLNVCRGILNQGYFRGVNNWLKSYFARLLWHSSAGLQRQLLEADATKGHLSMPQWRLRSIQDVYLRISHFIDLARSLLSRCCCQIYEIVRQSLTRNDFERGMLEKWLAARSRTRAAPLKTSWPSRILPAPRRCA